MALCTRLDHKSESNNRFAIVDSKTEEVLAIVTAVSPSKLEITTKEGLQIEKPNGFVSKR